MKFLILSFILAVISLFCFKYFFNASFGFAYIIGVLNFILINQIFTEAKKSK